jgi:cell division septum initiation protein DivIVA
VRVKPFDVRIGGTTMTVAGSNGMDQTIDYALSLSVPHAELGAAGGQTVAKLASQAGKAGIDLASAEIVQLGARVTGTITSPTVKPNFAGVASSARDAAKYAAREVVESHVADAKAKVDSAAEDARRRARAEADRIVQEAEGKAATIREEARALAARARTEANARADTLQARATSPSARLAAKVAADRIRREADQQADRVVREADARADALVAQARKQADALVPSKS